MEESQGSGPGLRQGVHPGRGAALWMPAKPRPFTLPGEGFPDKGGASLTALIPLSPPEIEGLESRQHLHSPLFFCSQTRMRISLLLHARGRHRRGLSLGFNGALLRRGWAGFGRGGVVTRRGRGSGLNTFPLMSDRNGSLPLIVVACLPP